MVEREKGVATAPCPTCGTDLKSTTQADGATAYEVCPKCYSTPEPEKAAKRTPRQTGTTVEQTGEEAPTNG